MTIFRRHVANKKIGAKFSSAQNTNNIDLREESRRYFRVSLPQPLQAKMTIVEIEGRQVETGKVEILIDNIGPGGLDFLASMRLPIIKKLVLEFTTQLLDEEITVNGKLIRMKEINPGYYAYGIEFDIDENERMKLIGLLNIVQARVRKKRMENSSLEDAARRYSKVG